MHAFKTSLYVVASVLIVTLLAACADRVLAREGINPSLDAAAFTALRMAYSQRPDFDPIWELDERKKALVAAAKAGNAEKVITLGQQWLETCPVDAQAHRMVGTALASIGRTREAARYRYVYWGLIASILESGTGESPESAMKVISVHEEYYVMTALLAVRIQQALIHSSGGAYDAITVRINGTEKELYFDVSIPIKADSKLFDELLPPELR